MDNQSLGADSPLDVLLKFKDTADSHVAQNLTTVLGAVADERAVAALVDMATGDTAAIKEHAISELARLLQGDNAALMSRVIRDVLLAARPSKRDAIANVIAEVRSRGGHLVPVSASVRSRLRTVDVGLHGLGKLWVSLLVSAIVFGFVAVFVHFGLGATLDRSVYVGGAALAVAAGVLVALTTLRSAALDGSYDPPLALAADLAGAGALAAIWALTMAGMASWLGDPVSAAIAVGAWGFVTMFAAVASVHLAAALTPMPSVRGLGTVVQTLTAAAAGLLVLHVGIIMARAWFSSEARAFRDGISPILIEASLFLGVPLVCSVAAVVALTNGGRRMVTGDGMGPRLVKFAGALVLCLALVADILVAAQRTPPDALDPTRTDQLGAVSDTRWLTFTSDQIRHLRIAIPAEEEQLKRDEPRQMDFAIRLFGWPSEDQRDSPTCGTRPRDLEQSGPLRSADDPPRLETTLGWGCYGVLIEDLRGSGFADQTLAGSLRWLVSRFRPDYRGAYGWRARFDTDTAPTVRSDGTITRSVIVPVHNKRTITIGEPMDARILVVRESGIAEVGHIATDNASLTITRTNAAGNNVALDPDNTSLDAGDRLVLESRNGRPALVELRRVAVHTEQAVAGTGSIPLTIDRPTWLAATLESTEESDLVIELVDSEHNVIASADDPEQLIVQHVAPGTYELVIRPYRSPAPVTLARPLQLRVLTDADARAPSSR